MMEEETEEEFQKRSSNGEEVSTDNHDLALTPNNIPMPKSPPPPMPKSPPPPPPAAGIEEEEEVMVPIKDGSKDGPRSKDGSSYWSTSEEDNDGIMRGPPSEQRGTARSRVVATFRSMGNSSEDADDEFDHSNNGNDDNGGGMVELPPPRGMRRKNGSRTGTPERPSSSLYQDPDGAAIDETNNNISTTPMTAEDMDLCMKLDNEYERALEEREVGYMARYHSVRQSACFAFSFFVVYLMLGTIFFLRQAPTWTIPDALLFSIYTITTVGYGNHEIPTSAGFQIYVIFFIFIGVATLTIMVAQIYQCVALEASRAQHSRDKSELARRGLDMLTIDPSSQAFQGTFGPLGRSSEEIIKRLHNQNVIGDMCVRQLEHSKAFFRDHPIGRGLSVIFPFGGLILVGAMVVGSIEGWNPVESVYFAVVSITTVGFGDFYPTHRASEWFCILWLPFSVGFMSLYLGNVAHFYIRLSDRNVRRVERRLRRRLQRIKERAERQREEVLRRAYRGQEAARKQHMAKTAATTPVPKPKEDFYDDHSEADVDGQQIPDDDDTEASQKRRHKRKTFDALPTQENEMHRDSMSRQALFGSPDVGESAVQGRRDRILKNSNASKAVAEATTAAAPVEPQQAPVDENGRPRGSTMSTMKDVLQTVHSNVASGETRVARQDSAFMSLRYTSEMTSSLQKQSMRKPSFALRVLVQERFAEIIATEIAGFQSSIEIKENTLSVTISTLKNTADKWLVPRRARRAFRAVAFEALYFVGEHGLITRGADAMYDLSPYEFHGLFSPLLAAMGDAETMEAWLASTDILANVELRTLPNDVAADAREGLACLTPLPKKKKKTSDQEPPPPGADKMPAIKRDADDSDSDELV